MVPEAKVKEKSGIYKARARIQRLLSPQGKPATIDEHLQRSVLTFVSHFRRFSNPVAQVQMTEAQSFAKFQLLQDAEYAQASGAFIWFKERINR